MKRWLPKRRRATMLLMVVGLLAMLFIILSAYITLARFDRLSLRQVAAGKQAEQIVDAVNNVTLSAIAQSWLDADGHALAGGVSTRDVTGVLTVRADYSEYDYPGAPGSRWLASGEPVRDTTLPPPITPADLLFNHVATTSATAGYTGNTRRRAIGSLLLDRNIADQNPVNSTPQALLDALTQYARDPRLDADGDGVPDSDLTALGLYTQLANAIGGASVQTPNYPGAVFTANYISLANPDPQQQLLARQYERYERDVRFEVTQRIVSNGGMLMLGAPAGATPTNPGWSTPFAVGMFNWLRHPSDRTAMDLSDQAVLDELAAFRAAGKSIEPQLRRRGRLATYSLGADSLIPSSLQAIQSRFKWTLLSANTRLTSASGQLRTDRNGDDVADEYWQKINLGKIDPSTGGELRAFLMYNTLDPEQYNIDYATLNNSDVFKFYGRRGLLTAFNNSDQLARKIDPALPRRADPVNGLTAQPGIYNGEQKFWLGEITHQHPSNASLDRGAFDRRGVYVPARGDKLVERLAGYYNEMLSGYEGWKLLPDQFSSPGEVSAVMRRQQAYMLAVNTIAAAAPRSSDARAPGFIDMVAYTMPTTDIADPDYGRTFVGYAPQPFITQVMAHRQRETNPDGTPVQPEVAHLALAVELYNPNDRRDASGEDADALWLSQFAFSLNSDYEANGFDATFLRPLDGTIVNMPPRLGGRSFIKIILNGGGANSYFEDHDPNGTPIVLVDLPVAASGGKIKIKLWRGGTLVRPDGTGRALYAKVDEFEVNEPQPPSRPRPGDPVVNSSFVDAWRDTSAEPYWGVDTLGQEARWRCLVAFDTNNANYKYRDADGDPHNDRAPDGTTTDRLLSLGAAGPELSDPASPKRFGPTIPLYVMNGQLGLSNAYSLNGQVQRRPASFPTVGFMHFVPRFAHTLSTLGTASSMSEYLFEQWKLGRDSTARPYAFGGNAPPPADFGHMPLFDNNQKARLEDDASRHTYYDDQRAGKLPWGLLVYDYFSTFNPDDPDGDPTTADAVDPLRVPGRININTAPWFVLSGLPMLGAPDANWNLTGLDRSISPAFWSGASGVMTGNPQYNLVRSTRFDTRLLEQPGGRSSWWRLGRQLAQSAASYRDKIEYVADTTLSPYAWDGSRATPRVLESGATPLRSSAVYGTIRQAEGFLGVGELMNVRGFDSYNDTTAVQDGLLPPLETSRVDFVKAVGLLAMLDTHWLTTRSNTFTVYTTIADRENPQNSVRTQVTIDRSNLLPRLVRDAAGQPLLEDTNNDGVGDKPVILPGGTLPEVLCDRKVNYFNTRYDN